ncbi:hypothetical protein [Sphingobacterium siyangense]|uniref:hypothetical protein n=1 Tax=Sphingobacterium siyangense TaxID=459529 RepID=UPI0031F85624
MTEKNIEEAIKDRLRNGFKNWNQGYDAWLEWCNTLYEPNAHYNIDGKRLTLQQYKDYMGEFFKVYEIELGNFYNMLVEDNWCGIRYSVQIKDKRTGEKFQQMSFEFVQFKNNPEPIGARVVEGWAVSDHPLNA